MHGGHVSDRASDPLAWYALPGIAQVYVAAIIAVGLAALIAALPRTYPDPVLFASLLILACVTSAWKVTLPLSLASGATLSVSYAADLMTLLLLGPRAAVIIAIAGAWMQCTFRVKRPYPLYRTGFSMAAEAITMVATGVAFTQLGGSAGVLDVSAIAKPLVGAIATYFFVNTSLIAGAIALSSERTWWQVWHDDFVWSAPSFMVAGSAGALAALVVQKGEHWKALLLIAPVYLTYRTYQVFVGRLDDQREHVAETQRLHAETLEALRHALNAERALAEEKERLGVALADMTRLEEARNQLLERELAARAAAEEANQVKDQFLAVVSHELRTPLNAILGWAELLRNGRLPDSKRDRASHAIYESAKRQAHLIDELLDVARIMSGKMRLDRSTVDLTETVSAAIAVVQPAIEAKHIKLVVDAEPPMPAVFGDSSRLQQIVWNLLSNAVKFTPDGGVVRIQLRTVAGAAELTVADSGDGIPDNVLQYVFEPFRQADGSTTRPHAGLGLGLSIVKQLVEAHGGTVAATNGEDGRGAVFSVRLPILSMFNRRKKDQDRNERRSEPDESLAGLSVLVVDDDEESRHVVAAHLESCRALVLTAASSAQAFDMLQRHHVDVLLADIAMPGEDGYALIRRLRALSSAAASIPAAALTAFAREEDRQAAFRAGFQLHLTKPVEAAALIAAVATLGRWNHHSERHALRV
jgi:signal transduction histidine kinase/ActR/RegA family two-component response regulator